MNQSAPSFPPLLSGHAVSPPDRSTAAALADLGRGAAGAGDVYWLNSVGELDVTIILEPEVALGEALQMPYVAQVAFGDAFGVLSPPETALHFSWPGTVRVNAAVVGRFTFLAPAGVAPDAVPDWLCLGLQVDVRGEDNSDPGLDPDRTNLYEEGCGEFSCADLTEAYCRHFTTWVHSWQEEGFRAVHDAWIGRATGFEEAADFGSGPVRVLGIDEIGNLMVKRESDGAVETLDFQAHVERC